MDEKKICFITCVNDEALYSESQYYIGRLHVPKDFQVERIALRGADSMAHAYNEAMKATHAKYKVYLHQDVFITNTDFISDLLRIFSKDDGIGMVALAGANRLLPDAILQNAAEQYGCIFDDRGPGSGEMKRHDYGVFEGEQKDVEVADDLLFATQCDIAFREELLDGFYFCGPSAALEYRKMGRRVVVPSCAEPWCVHLCGRQPGGPEFERARKVFLDAYSKDLFPLVSLLIPAYNQVEFLKYALESAIAQTYVNTEILISDDSTSDIVEKFLTPYLEAHQNLRYIRNPKHGPDFGMSNTQHCIDESRAEYLSFIYHDDLAQPDKLEKMMAYAIARPQVTLVTSAFRYIDQNGMTTGISRYFHEDTVLSGTELMHRMLTDHVNLVGAPSAAVIQKRYINPKGTEYYGDSPFLTCADMAMWFSVLEHGDGVYIAQPLSSFRVSAGQNSAKPEILISEQEDWIRLLLIGREKGIIREDEYKSLLCRYIMISTSFAQKAQSVMEDYAKEFTKLRRAMQRAVDELFAVETKPDRQKDRVG